MPKLGDVCRLELGFLDIRERSAVSNAVTIAEAVLDRTREPTPIKARQMMSMSPVMSIVMPRPLPPWL